MKEYFKRLKTHPGVDIANMMTILGFFAGTANNSFANLWLGGLFGFVFTGIIMWGIVLITNFKK